jgi:preprotein translocase subunit SecG
MYMFVVALHILLCILLVLIILLQPGKGGDVGAAFGGGGATSMFGARGPASLLSRATTVVAVLFMVTSVSLSIYSNRSKQQDADISGALERLQQEQEEQEKKKPEEGGEQP